MSFLLMRFLLFLIAAMAEYYVIPKQLQRVRLLTSNYILYLASGLTAAVFILTTTVTTFLGELCLERTDRALKCALRPDDLLRLLSTGEEKALREHFKQHKKWIAVLVLLVNFDILVALKHRNSAADSTNLLLGAHFSPAEFLLSLGISSCTFQSMGCLIDMHKGKYAPGRNLFRFALFVSFFPQTLQRSIGQYDRPALQLYGQKRFSLTRIERGFQFMSWGYFRRIVIVDRAAVVVNEVFGSYQFCHGIPVIAGVLCYSLQFYGDSSGGMDAVMDAAEYLGISLDANSKRPYFVWPVSDFRHRRHTAPGTWMKDYVFCSSPLSKGTNKLGKYHKKHFGEHVSRVLPVRIANLLVFPPMGVRHGLVQKFIVYGLYSGIIIAVGNPSVPIYT